MHVDHIVFYGTLRRGYPKHGELGLQRALRFVGLRTIRGALYDLGEYPGLVPGADPVEVELYRIRDPFVLSRLDRYEGFDAARPHESLFVRAQVGVDCFAGSKVVRWPAWSYWFNGSVNGRQRLEAAAGLRESARRWRQRARGTTG